MEVVLVTPRTAAPHPADETAAALARELAAAGHAVRWVRPVPRGRAPVRLAGVEVVEVVTRAVPFRAVGSALTDLPLERALSATLRSAPPDVVHVHGFGGASSYLTPWIADRLGVPAVVVASPIAEVLCHRRTLVDETGSECDAWDVPRRCAACCRAPATPGGLGRVQAVLAALLRPLGARSPFPSPLDFVNRLDMVAQGLSSARVVCVADATGATALERLGVSRRLLRVGVPSARASEWLPIYRSACGIAVH